MKDFFEKKSDNFFTYYSFPDVVFPSFGWKIHISATYKNHKEILKITRKFCLKNKKNFKFIKDKKKFFESISKTAPRTFSGKFITIYPSNVEDCKFILDSLFSLLKNFKGPEILTDRSYKGTILQYRYGRLRKDQDSSFEETLKPGFYKPENIADPFQRIRKNPEVLKIGGKYKITNAITFSNFGGTYRAEDESGKKYVIKEARPFLGFQFDNPILTRKREVAICKKLNCKWFPSFVKLVKLRDYLYTIFEYSQGISLRDLGENFSLIFAHNLLPERKEKIEILWENLIELIVELLIFTKEKGIILNDVKSENFLWDGGKNLKFIDLDFSFFVKNEQISILDTFSRKRSKTFWWNDVRNAGYMLMDLISCSRFLQNKYTFHKRIISYFEFFCRSNNINDSLAKKVLFLSNFKKGGSIKKIFEQKKKRAKDFYPVFDKLHVKYNFNLQTDLFKILNERKYDIYSKQKIFWFEVITLIEKSKKKEAKILIEKIINESVVNVFGEKIVITTEKKLSCYLNLGTSFLIYLLLFFKEKFKSTFFDEILLELLQTIARGNYLKIKFWNGALGVIITLIKASQIFENRNYLTFAYKHLLKFQWNFIKKSRNYVEYDSSFLQQWEKEMVETLGRNFCIS